LRPILVTFTVPLNGSVPLGTVVAVTTCGLHYRASQRTMLIVRRPSPVLLRGHDVPAGGADAGLHLLMVE